jgi:phosphomannomutase/phosphoglucomutase
MSAPPSFIFREYDIRGVADRDMPSDVAKDIGRGLGTMLRVEGPRAPRIAVGRDCRLSSPRLHEALVGGLKAQGVHVVDIGIGPTPLLYFAVHTLDADGGVMITGSHNPAEDNGFKVMRGKASFFGKDLQDLRELISKGAFGPERAGSGESVDLYPAYVAHMKAAFSFGSGLLPPDSGGGREGGAERAKLKFVVDAGNGAGGPLALEAMRALGLSPDPLFCEMDGRFPNHHPDPTVPKNLDALIRRVKETGARVGIAYDGDADRLGAVDQNGEIVWGDRLMILFSRGVLAKNPGAAILGEVKCSQTLFDDIQKHGGKPVLWKTGHSLIKTKMKETHALLAGEMSGHLFFADRYFGFDDAIYGSLRLLEILSKDPRSMSEMLSDVPKTFATPELRVDCPETIKFEVVKRVTEHYKAAGREVVDIDGARVQFGTPSAPAWGLVRASNTGPVLVMRFEAGMEAERDHIRKEVETLVDVERTKLGRA